MYIYGLEDLSYPNFSPLSSPRSSSPPSSSSSSGDREEGGCEIAVLYLAHNRTRTYKVTEDIAHEVLHQYRTDGGAKKLGLIAVTMNMRNHGDREVRT